ncbi:MAG: mannose-1-phosphate guanylyltransferase [Planctomycetes bacterium]|nr:mannose-1-phosphate guanylyltransferase [Planctomycetota bacterium]
MSTLHAVVMAGGTGTRFWPASRTARPKQFLPLADGKPMLQATIERLAGLCGEDQIWVVAGKKLAKPLTKLLPSLPKERLLLEPEARDTAPCIALATAAIAAADPQATMVVLPADHVIAPVDAFQAMLRAGAAIAQDGETLVTFGVAPTFPATGFGYVECGEPLAGHGGAHAVRRFREKPDRATAESFLQHGGFLWNSGIFVWRVDAILRAMRATDPELGAAADAMLAATQKGEKSTLQRAFLKAPKRSIDYAVMEKAAKVAVVRAPIRWNDVGNFPALGSIAPPDANGNVAVAADGGSCIPLQSGGNIVYADGARTVALFGVRDLVVVAVDDAVLVCPKDRAQDLKALVEHVRASGRADLL